MIRQVDTSGTARKWTNVRCVNAASAIKSVTKIRLVTGGGLKTLYDETEGGGGSNSLTLVASPASAGGGSKGATVTTVPVTVSVTGGTAPYSHSWTLSSLTDCSSGTATAPTSATTRFIGGGVSSDGGSAVFLDTVTDANGLTNGIYVGALFSRF